MPTEISQATLEPLFIVSPAARCGITLLQRLFNSTGQALIFGENAFLMAQLPAHVIEMGNRDLTAQFDQARERLLAGEYDFWSSSIWPNTGRWQQGVLESILRLLGIYQREAEQAGRSRWGIKNPLADPRAVALYFELLPRSRFIFLHRHVLDVMRSQKARRWLEVPGKLEQAVNQWRVNMDYMHSAAGGERLLAIRYEEMIDQPDAWSERLEAFAGVSGIDRSIFARKVNTFRGPEHAGYSPTEYIKPQPLSDDELATIAGLADATLAKYGYPPVAQAAA